MNNPFIFNKLNDSFDYLSFAEIINDLVLCLYCGNESNFFLEEIFQKFRLSLEVIHEATNRYKYILFFS